MRRQTPSHHTRGSALMELVLALPLFFLLLSLMFFFGRSLVRSQEAEVMSRYESERQAEHVPFPAPAAVEGESNGVMNNVFLGGDASSVAFRAGDGFPSDGADRLVELAGSGYAGEAGIYLDACFERFPAGSVARFTTRYDEANGFWQELSGPIHSAHARMANDWRFVNGLQVEALEDGSEAWQPTGPKVSNVPTLNEVFFRDFIDRLDVHADRGNELARVISRFYERQPCYVGPEVPLEWREDE